MLMQSFSILQLNSYYLQEDSIDRYLTELKMFFPSLIHFSYGFLFVFVYFIQFCYVSFVLKSQVFVTFLHLVLLAVSFVVINFLLS